MVSKTVTYLGASILQQDMPNSNFESSSADGLVFSPSTDSGDIIAEAYTTYAPTDTPNPLWNNVEIDWTRKTSDTTLPFKATFGLYGVTSMGDMNIIGEKIVDTITTVPVTEKVTFDLLHSACEANFNLTSDLAPAWKTNINLPLSYINYDNIQLQCYTPENTRLRAKFFTVTGSSDGDNVNFAVGPIEIIYDGSTATDFSDIKFWLYDPTVWRWIVVPKILIRKVNSNFARYFIELSTLNQSAAYLIMMTYGTLASNTPYWLNSPYTNKDNVYQGQLHLHTLDSDGNISLGEAAMVYRNLGYDWVAPSDHNFINPDPQMPGILYIPNVEYNNNSIDNPYERIHVNCIGAQTPLQYNPATLDDIITEASAASITYNGTTHTAHDMRCGRISGGTFGLATGNPKLAGTSTQTNIDYGLGEGCFVQLNHPTWLNSDGNTNKNANGFHAVAVYNAVNAAWYDYVIDDMLTTKNRFNIGIEDDTHTYYSGDMTTTLPTNVRWGTEASADTTGFSAWSSGGGGSNISSDLAYHSGSRSLKCATWGLAAQEGVYVLPTVVAGTPYMFHAWVNAPLGVAMALQKYDAVNGNVIQTFTGTGDWQHVTIQFTPGNTTPSVLIRTDEEIATTFYVYDILCYSGSIEGSTAYHVYADNLTTDDIIANLRAGNYYITYGDHTLELSVTVNEGSITATSNVQTNMQFITSNGIVAQTNNGVTTATYTPTINDVYVRVKATKYNVVGIALTNPIWVEEV